MKEAIPATKMFSAASKHWQSATSNQQHFPIYLLLLMKPPVKNVLCYSTYYCTVMQERLRFTFVAFTRSLSYILRAIESDHVGSRTSTRTRTRTTTVAVGIF